MPTATKPEFDHLIQEARETRLYKDIDVATTTIKKESPFPMKSPPDPESLLIEAHKQQLVEVNDAISNLDESIAIMQSQRDAYARTRARLQAGIDLQITGHIEAIVKKG